MNAPVGVPVEVRWYTPAEDGRRGGPPPGPAYATTGRFAAQDVGEMFSVVLSLPGPVSQNGTGHVVGLLSPGFPENVPDFAERIGRGERFILHEGRRAVAECVMAVPAHVMVGS